MLEELRRSRSVLYRAWQLKEALRATCTDCESSARPTNGEPSAFILQLRGTFVETLPILPALFPPDPDGSTLRDLDRVELPGPASA